MRHTLLTSITSALIAVAVSAGVAAAADGTIDNSALSKSEFRDHARTFGLVYTLPQNVNDVLDNTIRGPLKEKLLNAKLDTEAQMFNIPHVTVVHVHSADPATPEKMLAAMPKLPPCRNIWIFGQ